MHAYLYYSFAAMVVYYMWTHHTRPDSDISATPYDDTTLIASLCFGATLIAATFFGRVYYGVHSFPDVIGGVFMA